MVILSKNSVVYYFSENDIIKRQNYTIMYRIPYSKNTSWNTFKYGYIGNKINIPELDIKIISEKTCSEKTCSETIDKINKKENVWYSINSVRSKPHLYFQVTFPCLQSLEKGIRILLVGTISQKNKNRDSILSN